MAFEVLQTFKMPGRRVAIPFSQSLLGHFWQATWVYGDSVLQPNSVTSIVGVSNSLSFHRFYQSSVLRAAICCKRFAA